MQIFPDIHLIQWKKPWKNVVILWWIHWNEPTWVLVIKKLIERVVAIDSWQLYLILGNPQAIQENTRFIVSNMNRCFFDDLIPKNNEEERVVIIKDIIKRADLVIDIHNTIRKNTFPFIITESIYSPFISFFEPEYIVHWLVNLHPWSTDWYGRTHWVESLCIEAGSISNPIPFDNIYNSIVSILIHQHMLFNDDIPILQYKNKKNLIAKTIVKAKSLSWEFLKERWDFDFIESWTIIWYEDWKELSLPYSGYILFPKLPKQIDDEVFVFVVSEDD